jgi:hypothetical protein
VNRKERRVTALMLCPSIGLVPLRGGLAANSK